MVRVKNKMISVKFGTLYTKTEEEVEKKNQREGKKKKPSILFSCRDVSQ
jgi:hypothetical protein|tara:strand:+ start:144 stop:290 length:147 start_codon:yes stop_codon:yes gene_type:complete